VTVHHYTARTSWRASLNPEQLLVAAASSCQLLEFLALAARARVEVLSYDDDAEGVMDDAGRPARIERIVLRPRIHVAAGTSEERVLKLVDQGHRLCYVANSLTTEIQVEATVTAG
jgi:organic hydroperoxide reductase OsmC/OhrA